MIAGPQTFSASLVVRASSWPSLQVGTPLALIEPFLSVSRTNEVMGGGCDPSAVAILPETLRLIGVGLVFDSLVGVKPPLKVSTRLPTLTTTGL